LKLLVIGVGDCGSRISSCFSNLNKKAKADRRVQIITGAYAVNNNRDELLSMRNDARDLQTVFINHMFRDGQSAVEGADMMRIEGGRVITAIRPNDFYDTDAILMITGTAGRFGSGGVPVLIQHLKDRHVGKPIFAMAILPFESEADNTNVIYNTALCLKSLQKVSEGVFLVDDEKYRLIEKLSSIQDKKSLNHINNEIVSSFYDLLCATETLDPKLAGARSLGIGDMLQTLSGWTTIGSGKTSFPMSRSMFKQLPNFQEKGSETQKAMEAMNLALSKLTIDVKLEDAGKALYLLSIPARGANVDMVKVLGNRLREMTHNALIRGGDFYGVRDSAAVTLVFSELNYVERVKKFYDNATIGAAKPEIPPEMPTKKDRTK
jgi:cell division GTPase FtsZ